MAQIIGMDPSVLSRYLDVARLDQNIVEAVADVREISRNQVRELKAVMEPGARLSKPQADENRETIIERARELAAEEVKRPALDVFRALMAAASSDKTKRGRPSTMLGEVQARSSGKTAVVARTKGRRGLILELYGESGAQGDEVIEAIRALDTSHYRPV